MDTQQRPRGFAPLFRGPGGAYSDGFAPLFRAPRGAYSDQHLRVSDAERQAVTDRLAGHFADGRLDQEEFDERAGRAMGARTRADLAGLLDDLPGTGAPAGPPVTAMRRRRPVRSFLAIVAILVIAMAAGHAALHLAAALAWAGLIAAALIAATRHAGRSRARHDQ